MIRFLRRLFSWSSGSELRADLPDPVAGDELLTRYIYESNKYSHSKLVPTKAAFLPEPYNGRLETSVCRILGLSSRAIWRIADTIRGRRALARADLTAGQATACTPLHVISEKTLHPRHAVVVGWPQAKHAKNMLALQLASVSTLSLRDD